MTEDSGFRDIKRKPKPGWKRWQPPPSSPDRWARWGLREKTVWDWLDLMIVPLMLAVFAGFFATFQILYQTWAEERLQEQIANQNAQFQQQIEQGRAQEASMQNYLDLMTNLLLKYNLGDGDTPDSKATAIARAQTLTTLRKMDSEGKRTVARFLVDADLIQGNEMNEQPVLILFEADLTDADLTLTNLHHAYLPFVLLQHANLHHANLEGAVLPRARLDAAQLDGANLRGANLEDANLEDANLEDANLEDANLSNAKGWTEDQLRKAKSLEGATMPNGQKYED